MTCIVGIETPEGVWIGGDSFAGSHQGNAEVREDPKVFTVGPLLIGFTTSYAMGQALRYRLIVPAQPDGEDTMCYLVTRLIPAFKDAMDAAHFTKTEHGRVEGGQFLLGYRGRLYAIHSDFQVARYACGFASCGSGAEVALGSLHTSAFLTSDPKRRVWMSLDAATANNAFVRPPYIIEFQSKGDAS